MCIIVYYVPSLKHWREFGSMARVPYSLQKTHCSVTRHTKSVMLEFYTGRSWRLQIMVNIDTKVVS